MAKIVVDAEMLIMALEDQDGGLASPRHFLDLETGEVEYCPMDEENHWLDEIRAKIEEHPERYRNIEPCYSSEGYADMQEFIEQLSNDRIANQLARAIASKSPFRRFKDALTEYPKVREAWFKFHDLKMAEAAQEWLDDQGVDAELKYRQLQSK